MEINWQLILFIYVILAFALYGIFHWIEEVLDLPIVEHNQNPSNSYEHLRKIVHTIAQEVIKLPEFYNQRGFSSVDANQVQSSFEPKVYEDLLATAVINKIVETYNDKKYENSSGIHSGGSDLDSSCHIDQNNQHFNLSSRCSSTELRSEYSAFNDRLRSPSMKTAEIIDEIFREKLGKQNNQSATTEAAAASGPASVHSELSDYIQKHKIALPDFEFEDIDDDDNDNGDVDQDSDEIEQEFQSIYASSTAYDSNTNFSDISDNWLFRKVDSGVRGGAGGSTSSIISGSSPVGMLVPSPTQDCPTLIGNRVADEISDLSENDDASDKGSIRSANGISDADESNSDCEQQPKSSSSSSSSTSKLGHLPNPFDLPHVLVGSKTLIGGKNEMNSFEQSKAALIDLLEPDSLVSEPSLTGQSPAISEAKNNLILIEDRSSSDHPISVQAYQQHTMDQTFNVRNNEMKTQPSNRIDTSPDLLIKFDSLEAYNGSDLNEQDSNNVEIVSRSDKSAFNVEYEPKFRNDSVNVNRFTDKPCNANVDVVLRTDAQTDGAASAVATLSTQDLASYQGKSATHANDEYTNDSLEFNAANKGSIRNNGNGNKGDDSDTIEQDSLETNKVSTFTGTNDGKGHVKGNGDGSGGGEGDGDQSSGHKLSQFLPFAHIGKNWSNECVAAQNNTDENRNCSNNITNPFIEIESANQTNAFDAFDVQTNQCSLITNNQQSSENEYQDLPGSIAEREHMKWKNAVELPNNPYSAEALQRRLSQTSQNKFTDIERLTSKFTTATTITSQLKTDNPPRSPAICTHDVDKPIKVVLGSHQVNPERYGRDYYINDAKTASGSRSLKSSGDLNLHQTIDDYDDVNYDDDNDGVFIAAKDGEASSDNNNNHKSSNNHDDVINNRSKRYMENDYNTSDSVSDLLDSIIRSEQKCRYRYAHLPKPLTTLPKMHQLHPTIDVQRLERSQSVCSLQTGLRNRFNRNNIIADAAAATTSSWVLNGQQRRYDSLRLNRQKWRPQRPSSPSPSLPVTLPTYGSSVGDEYEVFGSQSMIAHLERDTLHRDIRRNSLSSRRGTRNFVINPLFNE